MADYCKFCGHKLREGAKFCPGCGKQLVKASVPPDAPKQEVSSGRQAPDLRQPPPVRNVPPSEDRITDRIPGNENQVNPEIIKQTAKRKDSAAVSGKKPGTAAAVLLGFACLFLFIAIILTAPARIKAAMNGAFAGGLKQDGMLLESGDDKAAGKQSIDAGQGAGQDDGQGDEEDQKSDGGNAEDNDDVRDTQNDEVTKEMIENNSENYKPAGTHGNYEWLYGTEEDSSLHSE